MLSFINETHNLQTACTESRTNAHPTNTSVSSVAADAPPPKTGEETRILSFDELRELILHGKTDQIPNNKDIPDKLNVPMLYSYNIILLI